MQKRLLIAISIIIVLALIGTVFIKYPRRCPDGRIPRNNDIGLCPEKLPENTNIEKGTQLRCPNGTIPRNNDIGLCPEEIPSDIDKGIEKSYSSFTCMEFKDTSKNYVPGEIIIGVNTNIKLTQIQNIIKEIEEDIKKEDTDYSVSIKQEILENSAYLLEVPKGWELNIINRFIENPNIEYAELNGCSKVTPRL